MLQVARELKVVSFVNASAVFSSVVLGYLQFLTRLKNALSKCEEFLTFLVKST